MTTTIKEIRDVKDLFSNKEAISEIQKKLPKMFLIAEIESSRAGKMGMEVGSLRERVIISYFIYKFGEWNVKVNLPPTEHEVDVLVNDKPYSIKTITGNGGVKAVWTVDRERVLDFIKKYTPQCDIILVNIRWGENGGIFLIPLEAQKEIAMQLKNAYLKAPKPGTNPRGIEFSKEAMTRLLVHPKTLKIVIQWKKEVISYDVFGRWVEAWATKN